MIDFRAYQKRRNEQLQMAWINGYYTKIAIQSSIMVCALADKTTAKNLPKYPDMPKFDGEDEKESESEIEAKRQYAIAKMNYWTRVNNKRFKDKKEV